MFVRQQNVLLPPHHTVPTVKALTVKSPHLWSPANWEYGHDVAESTLNAWHSQSNQLYHNEPVIDLTKSIYAKEDQEPWMGDQLPLASSHFCKNDAQTPTDFQQVPRTSLPEHLTRRYQNECLKGAYGFESGQSDSWLTFPQAYQQPQIAAISNQDAFSKRSSLFSTGQGRNGSDWMMATADTNHRRSTPHVFFDLTRPSTEYSAQSSMWRQTPLMPAFTPTSVGAGTALTASKEAVLPAPVTASQSHFRKKSFFEALMT